MAHEIEFVNGIAQMAYAGETPWHGFGKRVPDNLTPVEMLNTAGLNWTVEKQPLFFNDSKGIIRPTNHSALTRGLDEKVLDVVSNDWEPVQNIDAFEFFNEFITAGDMEMHTAGSLKGGQIVWALAKVKESFELFKGDTIESYLLFTNFHKYGFSTDVRFTPIRVVCNNTLSLSLSSAVERMVKYSHRRVFKPEEVKGLLGIAANKLEQYHDMAAFLGSKKTNDNDLLEYFKQVFPVSGASKKKEVSKNAALALSILHTQPGSEYAEGTWWQPLNAVTFITDHLAGRSADSRLTSAWYGANRNVKLKALELATQYAEAA